MRPPSYCRFFGKNGDWETALVEMGIGRTVVTFGDMVVENNSVGTGVAADGNAVKGLALCP